MTGAGGSVRLAYGNFYFQKPMAECFRRFYTAHLFCHPLDDLIQSYRGFHKTDSTRACLTKKYNRRKLFFQITIAQSSFRCRVARRWPA